MKKLCSLSNIAYQRDRTRILQNINWTVVKGKLYAVVGENGSGKTSLAEIMAGKKEATKGRKECSGDLSTGYLSFEEQEDVLAGERKKNETWFGDGRIDYGSTGAELIGIGTVSGADYRELRQYVDLLRIGHILSNGCRQYSTGEFRKVLLCRELLRFPDLMLLDEPYDGLDTESRKHIRELLPYLRSKGVTVVLFLHRKSEVPDLTDEVLYLYGGSLHDTEPAPHVRHDLKPRLSCGDKRQSGASPAELIAMNKVEVAYEGKQVLTGIDWRAYEGETWMITGPNGSGKSTLLSLVSGDNPKAYGQEIYLFGRKRGSGESVWDIKSRIGFVSGDLQLRYYVRASVRDVVISGLYDSIGLYRQASDHDIHRARSWLRDIGLEGKEEEAFHHLSFGEQRMVLLARALIKEPKILIADEPCQGLDEINRDDVLRSMEIAAGIEGVLILYVTHEPEEYLHVPYHHLELIPHGDGAYTNRITAPSSPA